MMVHEPRRWFWEHGKVRLRGRAYEPWRQELARSNRVALEDIIRRDNDVWIRRVTEERKRHFLVGRDERQLFMCRLPHPCTTVADAHAALRVPQARLDARSVIERAIRQGEWFFVPAEPSDEASIEADLVRHEVWIWRRVSIGRFISRAGKPHIVDELVDTRYKGGAVFARGRVRHVDHRTARLHRWYRVLRNREVDEGRSPFGGGWID
jgi:hypothetical protein